MSTADDVAKLCDRAGMEPTEPLRVAMVGLGRAADAVQASVVTVGQKAAQEAANGATAVVRSEVRRILLATHAFRVALYVAVPLVTWAVGYWAGASRTVPTNIGPLSPASLAILRANDVDASVSHCHAQPPKNGKEWCTANFWRPTDPP